jgi:hypothetical protein
LDYDNFYLSNNLFSSFFRDDSALNPSYEFLCSLLNSRLLQRFLRIRIAPRFGNLYVETKIKHLDLLPIRRIAFTTPSEERERLAAEGITEATEWIEATERGSVRSTAFSAFSDSNLGAWLDTRLSATHTPEPELVEAHNADPLNADHQLPEEGPVEQSDVVHDLLAHLAERMIAMHKERQQYEDALDPFKYIDKGAPFVPFPEAFAEEIKLGQRVSEPVDLGAVHHDIDGLRLVPAGDRWELQVELKKRDPESEWREWQYEEGSTHIAREWVPVYQFAMDEAKARYYQHALPVRDDFAEAGGFPGGYTRSTAKKLQKTEVPAFDPDVDLSQIIDLSEKLAAVRARIAATDRLIDLIVYRLYGLTEEEVAIVEGREP